MAEDARFEDGAERPLSLAAESTDDLEVISALVQDAVVETGDIRWLARKRRAVLLINRFRWEDKTAAEQAGRSYERVRAILQIGSALGMTTQGIDPGEKAMVLDLLGLSFTPDGEIGGRLTLAFAGEGEIALDVECVDLRLQDVSQPYAAISGLAPNHPVADDG